MATQSAAQRVSERSLAGGAGGRGRPWSGGIDEKTGEGGALYSSMFLADADPGEEMTIPGQAAISALRTTGRAVGGGQVVEVVDEVVRTAWRRLGPDFRVTDVGRGGVALMENVEGKDRDRRVCGSSWRFLRRSVARLGAQRDAGRRPARFEGTRGEGSAASVGRAGWDTPVLSWASGIRTHGRRRVLVLPQPAVPQTGPARRAPQRPNVPAHPGVVMVLHDHLQGAWAPVSKTNETKGSAFAGKRVHSAGSRPS